MTTKALFEIAKTLFVFVIPLAIAPALIWAERRICAGIQGRIGPNRVGPYGLLQPLADVIKLLFKEEITPRSADKFLYTAAPVLAMVPPLLIFGLIPVAGPLNIGSERVQFPAFDLGLGILLFMALTSIGVYGVTFGGWASNNKYSLLGGLRSTAQMISYELVLTLSIIAVMMQTNTVSLAGIVRYQQEHAWLILRQAPAAVLFYIAALAENKRLPFDLPEAESELVGGYHTEYSSMKFALFFMGEYIAVMAMSGLFVTMFLGGWLIPGMDLERGTPLTFALSFGSFLVKMGAVIFVYIWIRWTLPRFKYNRLMELSWTRLVPAAFAWLLVNAVIVAATGDK